MIEQISTIVYMDGNGLYVWSCVIILLFKIGLNIYIPTRKLIRIYKGNKLQD